MSSLYTCPQVELKIFLERKARARNFYVFGGKMSERPGAGPTTGTGNEKQRTLGKSILPGLLPFYSMLLAHFAFLLKCRCVQGNHFRFEKKKKQ